MKRRELTIVQRTVDDDSPERFARLTRHIRIQGMPMSSMKFTLEAEKARGLQMPKDLKK